MSAHPNYLLPGSNVKSTISGVTHGVVDFAFETWNNPRFQGGLQAFGGLTEAMIGGGIALGGVVALQLQLAGL